MGNRAQERLVFESLLGADDQFLGEELAEWSQPLDQREFPDVTARTVSGRRIGIELGEWLNERETAASISAEKAQTAMLTAIGPHRLNVTNHVRNVWLARKPGAKVRPADADQFSYQLYSCIDACDSDDTLWDSPAGHFVSSGELRTYPVLARYLQGLTLHRRKAGETWPSGRDWIGFPYRGGAYAADTMLDPLVDLVQRKCGHYARSRLGFDHLALVVFYDRALLCNSPVETLEFWFEDAVRIAGDVIGGDPGPFDSAFVFDTTTRRVHKIYPEGQ
jgi:hypothetical protein